MLNASRRRMALVGITLLVTVAALALALPALAPVRRAVSPQLAPIVLVLGGIAGVWQLVAGIARAVARGGVDRVASISLLLGASAIAMALAFVPPGARAAPRLVPLAISALFAGLAALLSRASRARAQH